METEIFALARTSGIMLNRGDQSRHPSFVLDLRGKFFHVSLLSMMLVASCHIILRYIFSFL